MPPYSPTTFGRDQTGCSKANLHQLAQGVASTGFLARLVSKYQPPGVQRRRVDVDAVAVIVIPGRHAVQHDRQRNWFALLIERHLLGKLGQLDLPERERAVAQTLDGAAYDLVARPRSVDAPCAADEVEIFCQCALTHLIAFEISGEVALFFPSNSG